MSEKTGIQWTDYPEIERFVAAVIDGLDAVRATDVTDLFDVEVKSEGVPGMTREEFDERLREHDQVDMNRIDDALWRDLRTDYPAIERFVAGVGALCAEALKTLEGAANPAGLLEPSARVAIRFSLIADLMLLHDALPDALRCVKWGDGDGEKPRCE